MIFCSGAQHGGPADIDVFDGISEGAVRLGNSRTKGIQIDHEQVDTFNAML